MVRTYIYDKVQSLIVMDDVSGLADKSNTFVNFLIVAKKFGKWLRLYISNYFTGKRNLEKINIANKSFQYFAFFGTLSNCR